MRIRSLAFGTLTAASLLGTACGVTTPADTQTLEASQAQLQAATTSTFQPSSRVHAMPLRDPKAPAAPINTATTAHLTYYGGKVIPNVKVVVVYWGPSVSSTVTSGIGGYYSAVTNSAYFDWLSEYNTGTQSIGRGTLNSTVTITPGITGSSLTDAQIQTELNNQMVSGKLPAPDANTLYMTYFPPGTTITQGGSGSCVAGGFCAYHGTVNGTKGEFYYGVIPDMGPGSGCDTGCGSSTQFNNITSVSSHEMIEAVTDAEVGIATVVGAPLAWYDATNGEIGDICNAQQGTIAGYTVQKEWDNATNACIVSKATGGDTTPPTTSLTAPTAGATVSGTAATVSANASDNVGVSKVEFYVDGSLIATDTTSPYSVTWNTTGSTNGSHALTSKAYDAAGNVGTSSAVSVTVSNSTGGGNPVINPGFESGNTAWTASTGVINNSATLAHAGSWEAYLNGYGTTHTDTLSQSIAIPATATGTLSFYLKITTSETGTTAFDKLTVTLKNSAGTVLTTLGTYSNVNASTTYALKSFNVAAYKGTTVTLSFSGVEDSSLATSFYVDDVAVQ